MRSFDAAERYRQLMLDVDLERLLSEPIYAFDFQSMIGDVEDFLDFSENNIDWQYRRELQDISHRVEAEEFPQGYKEHLEANAEYRFRVSLPLRVRYASVVALTTSVEWAVGYLMKRLKVPLSKRPSGCNGTVHGLLELQRRTDVGSVERVRDYEALVQVRNCIAHSAGIEERYKFRGQLAAAVDRLSGFSLGHWHFFGRHVCIEKGALNRYVQQMGELIVALHKAAHEQCLLRNDP
jgi:hypothetical protein